MTKDSEAHSTPRKVFDFFIGCAQIISTVVGVIALIISFFTLIWAVNNPNAVPQIIQLISGEATSTPISIAMSPPTTQPTYTSLPTYTPYPTNTPSPTIMLISTPSAPLSETVSLPFNDNFDLRMRPEWEQILGSWRAVNGRLTADLGSNEWAITQVGDENWKNYIIDIKIEPDIDMRAVRVIFRANENGYIAFQMDFGDYKFIISKHGEEKVIAIKNDRNRVYDYINNSIRIVVKDDIYTAYINGTQQLQVQDSTFLNGKIGLAFRTLYPVWFDELQIESIP